MKQTTTYTFEFTPRELEFLAKMKENGWYGDYGSDIVEQYQPEWLLMMSFDIITTSDHWISVTEFGTQVFESYPAPLSLCRNGQA